MAKKKEDATYIQSVDRALTLLEHIAENPKTRPGLAELAEVLHVDRSSVFRLLATLMKHGLVRQVDSRASYQLGFDVFRLAGALRSQLKITEVASDYLRKLAANSRENAHLAVRSGLLAVFIDREQGGTRISANTNIGDTEDLYCTAVGRCLICETDRNGLEELFGDKPLIAYTDRTITDLGLLAAELQTVRERGFAIDLEEYERNVVCVAAPVYNFEGRVEASIGISGPRERIEPKVDILASIVREMGEEISGLLGKKQNPKPRRDLARSREE